MSCTRPSPPTSEQQLLERCQSITGISLGELAARLAISVPADLRRHKGWVGQLLELALGADAGSRAEPDFVGLGIELKTLPLDQRGLPRESTYVCTVALERGNEESWETSWLRRKLARVLWVPVEADPAIPLAQRYIGSPLLWSPDSEQQALLRRDWQELMDMVCMGQLEAISARLGEVLQIRPKAANARVLTRAIGHSGNTIQTNPRGFYLRPAFTRQIIESALS